jgi:serine/threonine protein phosphatase 1
MRTIAIGDIHGSFTALTTLLEAIRPTPDDRIIFLGDYVDGGPDSKSVLDSLISEPSLQSAIFLRGNHEVMMLEARDDPLKSGFWFDCGGFNTLLSYDAEKRPDWPSRVPASHWRFLENTRRFHETENHIFIHAGLDPDLDLADQPDFLLFWEFFDTIQPHHSGKKIVCGHSRQESGAIKDLGFAVCIDTGACKGGWLTGLDVESGNFWQANETGQTHPGRLS